MTIKTKKINRAITQTLKFIKDQQEPDGSFKSITFNLKEKTRKEALTPFTTSLILCYLAQLKDHPDTQTISSKGIDFLMREKSQNWSWNYWPRNSRENIDHPCPDDLDDTFCSLRAIAIHKPEMITPSVWVAITKTLTNTESEPGGPYHTWIVEGERSEDWKDLDTVVNSNISRFLKLYDIKLPKLESFLKQPFTSKYYPSSTAKYFMGDFSLDSEKSFDLKTKYKAEPLYIEAIKGVSLYNGSAVLTAAFYLENLCRIREKYKEKLIEKQGDQKSKQVHNKIVREVRGMAERFPKETYSKISVSIDKLSSDDQITLLPYYFSESLGSKLSERFIITLGTANLCGWLAYKIYDDILDNEGGLELLPLATLYSRRVTEIHEKIFTGKYKKMYKKMMDEMDLANSWERLNTYKKKPNHKKDLVGVRGNYSHLAQKSMPHCLGVLAILIRTKNQKGIKKIIQFFKHYLIARQLNDDAHDWQDDLERGFMNPCGAKVLKIFGKKRWNMSKDLEELRRIFWDKVIVDVARIINNHIELGKESLCKVKIIRNSDYLSSLMEPIQNSTTMAIEGRRRAIDFLKKYEG